MPENHEIHPEPADDERAFLIDLDDAEWDDDAFEEDDLHDVLLTSRCTAEGRDGGRA